MGHTHVLRGNCRPGRDDSTQARAPIFGDYVHPKQCCGVDDPVVDYFRHDRIDGHCLFARLCDGAIQCRSLFAAAGSVDFP